MPLRGYGVGGRAHGDVTKTRFFASRRLGTDGPQPPTPVCEGLKRSVAADHPGRVVLTLAADCLDDVSDVGESEGAHGVDGLVHLAEALSVGQSSALVSAARNVRAADV